MNQATQATATPATAEKKAKAPKVLTPLQQQLADARAAAKAQREALKALNAQRKAEAAAGKEAKAAEKLARAETRLKNAQDKEAKRLEAIKRAEDRLAKLKAAALGEVATVKRAAKPRKNGPVTVMRPDENGNLVEVDVKAEKAAAKASKKA